MRTRNDRSSSPNEAPRILNVSLEVETIERLSISAVSMQGKVLFNSANTLATMARFTDMITEVFDILRDPFAMMEVSEVQHDASALVKSKLDLAVPSNVPNSWPSTSTALLPEKGWALQLFKF